MAVELDAVSKLLVADYGWTDLGDGTVTNPDKTVVQSYTRNPDAPTGYDVSSKPYVSTETEETVVEAEPAVAANTGVTETVPGPGDFERFQTKSSDTSAKDTSGTTETVSGQTEQVFQDTAGSSGSAVAGEATIDTGIVENQNPVNVGSVDNLEGVTVPDYASGATHYNSATGQYALASDCGLYALRIRFGRTWNIKIPVFLFPAGHKKT